MTTVKICGLTRIEDIACVNEEMPEYIGFVFAKSRRQVTKEQARQLRHLLDSNIQAVGVFVNPIIEDVIELLNQGIIDMAQLHGQEPEEMVIQIKEATKKPVIKAVSVQTREDILKWCDSKADYLLLDQGSGGTGETFSWDLIGDISKPYFIAGGLDLSNVKEAKQYGAYGLDVSSGVETEGKKEALKIKTFIKLVRED